MERLLFTEFRSMNENKKGRVSFPRVATIRSVNRMERNRAELSRFRPNGV